jgi:solute carrier family 35 protein E3
MLTIPRVFNNEQLKACQLMVVMWHFAATGLVLYISTRAPFRVFKPVRLSPWQMAPVCAFFAAYVILGNLSLTFNSIGFYQLAKVMTTPCVVLLNFVLFRKTITRYMLAAIVAICMGVVLTIRASAHTQFFGVIIAVLAFTSTALYQIWIGKKIEDFEVSAPQLLLNQAPISVILLVPFVPFFDKIPDIHAIPTDIILALCASGIMASLLNLSQFLIIGRTSALTVSSGPSLIYPRRTSADNSTVQRRRPPQDHSYPLLRLVQRRYDPLRQGDCRHRARAGRRLGVLASVHDTQEVDSFWPM